MIEPPNVAQPQWPGRARQSRRRRHPADAAAGDDRSLCAEADALGGGRAAFTELALRLIDLVDAQTRAIVADKIAGYPNAPAAVRQRLLREHIALGAAERSDRRPSSACRQRSRRRRTERAVLCRQRRGAAADPAQPALCAAAAGRADRRGDRARVRSIGWKPRRSGTTAKSSPASSSARSAISRAQARRLIDDDFGRADRGGGGGARHAGRGAAADPALPQPGDQPIGAAGL